MALQLNAVNLGQGFPNFPCPQFIKDAAKQAIDENYTTYTPVAGYDELREKLRISYCAIMD